MDNNLPEVAHTDLKQQKFKTFPLKKIGGEKGGIPEIGEDVELSNTLTGIS